MCTEWEVKCKDAAGRERETTIRVTDSGVSILTPPGGSGTFTLTEAKDFGSKFLAATGACLPRQVYP